MKRVTIFAGHYGSGKTNISVNYAINAANEGKSVSIADLDIVNPYFRSKDMQGMFEEMGVKFISSDYANSNVDTPALPADAYSIVADKSTYAVVDVGGDDRGALALGRYVPGILEENDYQMLFVINKFRPLTSDAISTLEVMAEIESACKMKFTGIVNNSNIGEDTTPELVMESMAYADEVSKIANIPVVYTTVDKAIYPELKDKIQNLMPLTLYVRQSWQK